MKVLVVDSCPATRLGLRVILQEEDIEVVGEAATAEEALHLTDKLCPDLVILDIELGENLEGLQVCKRMKASWNNRPRVLVFTANNSREDVAAVSLAGADGYLHKGVDAESIRETVSRVHRDERIWMLGPAPKSNVELGALIEGADLTPKESEILVLLLRRHTNAEIATELCLSRNTIKSHVSSILRKLGLDSRQEILTTTHPKGSRRIIPLR